MPERIWYLLGVKLSGEASQAELDEYYTLLEQHPHLEASVQSLTRYWHQSYTKGSTNELWQMHLERAAAKGIVIQTDTAENAYGSVFRLFRSRFFFIASAAAVLILIAGMWFFNTDQTKTALSRNEVTTRPASRSRLTLADGSEVWLNGSSKLVCSADFAKGDRNVWLEGEGYFVVAKNKAVPFIIHTKRMNIKVTGTVFNVRAYPQETAAETSLIEGSVEVTVPEQGNKKYYLKPQQKLIVEQPVINNRITVSTGSNYKMNLLTAAVVPLAQPVIDSLPVETSWVNNILSFSDESFRQLANKMENWYGVKVVFDSEDLEQLRFTGSFKNETLKEALTALQLTTSFSYKTEADKILITKTKR